MPRPRSPMSSPSPKYSSSDGNPLPALIRTATTATRSTAEARRRTPPRSSTLIPTPSLRSRERPRCPVRVPTVPRRRVLRLSLLGVAALLVVVLVVAFVGTVVVVRRPFPAQDGSLSLPGLSAPVTVVRDDRGIPQIYASSADDLFRVQGYVQAQDRFFEMDFRRHVTAGRLSELVGKDDTALQSDKVVRTLGCRRVAQQELAQADPTTRRYLDDYARGVNDYVASKSPAELSVNYAMLGLDHPLPRIEPWTALDSVTWFKALAWDLRGNYNDELSRARILGTVKDVERVEQLYPSYPYAQHEPIVPGGQNGARTPPAGASTPSPSPSPSSSASGDAVPAAAATPTRSAPQPGTRAS